MRQTKGRKTFYSSSMSPRIFLVTKSCFRSKTFASLPSSAASPEEMGGGEARSGAVGLRVFARNGGSAMCTPGEVMPAICTMCTRSRCKGSGNGCAAANCFLGFDLGKLGWNIFLVFLAENCLAAQRLHVRIMHNILIAEVEYTSTLLWHIHCILFLQCTNYTY